MYVILDCLARTLLRRLKKRSNINVKSQISILPVPTSLPAHNVSIGNAVAGSIIAAGYSDYIFLGLATTGSTPAGAVNQKVFSLTFDET